MKILIVDNEPDIRRGIAAIIGHYATNISEVFEAGGVADGIKTIQTCRPNIVITDVEMDDGTGIEMLGSIPKIDFQVIFITAYSKYAIDAFKFSAIDFLLKPIEPTELIKAINKAMGNINIKNTIAQLQLLQESISGANANTQKIVLKDAENVHFVYTKDIVFCKADGNYTHFELIQGDKIMVSKPIGEYEAMLDSYQFVRTHHSYLVNIAHVRSFNKTDGGVLIMKSGIQVPVSQRKRDKILDLLSNFKA